MNGRALACDLLYLYMPPALAPRSAPGERSVPCGCMLPQHSRRSERRKTRGERSDPWCDERSRPLHQSSDDRRRVVMDRTLMPTILVVEDDPDMRAIYRLALETAGFAILEA